MNTSFRKIKKHHAPLTEVSIWTLIFFISISHCLLKAEETVIRNLESVRLLAEYSDLAYGEEYPVNKPGDGKLIHSMYDTKSGFYAKAYKLPTGAVVIAFAGTHFNDSDGTKMQDLKTDRDIFLQMVPEQFDWALEMVDAVRKNEKKAKIILTGHSLGGALANYAGFVRGLPSIAFNAPSLNLKMGEDIENRGIEPDQVALSRFADFCGKWAKSH